MEDNDEISQSILELDEDEIDNELELPKSLSNYSIDLKRQLVVFKRNHTEIEWETEVLRINDLQQKQQDYARLARLNNAKIVTTLGDSDQEEDAEEEADDNNDDIFDFRSESDNDNDDLFNSDEEDFLTSKYDNSLKPVKSTDPTVAPVLNKRRVVTKLPSASKKKSKSHDVDAGVFSNDEDDDCESETCHSNMILEKDESGDATFNDHLKLQLRREQLTKLIHEPYFEDAVGNTFVRISLGETNGINLYAMAEITGISRHRSYKLENNKSTDIRLIASIGGEVKPFRISLVSNSRISESEFLVYKARLNGKLITKNEATRRRKHLVEVTRNHKYTREEVHEMINKKRGFNKAVVTNYSTALDSLKKILEKAYSEKDWDVVERALKEKEILEREIIKEKALIEQLSKGQVSLNRRNKEINFKKDMIAGQKKMLESSDTKNNVSSAQDPFVRRETRPQNIWKTGATLEFAKKREDIQNALNKLKEESPSDTIGMVALEVQLNEMNSKITNDKKSAPKSPRHSRDTGTAVAKSGSNDELWKSKALTVEEIRARIKLRMGADPVAVIESLTPRQRYLLRVCNLPPIDSDERQILRGPNGLSLKDYLAQMD